jgi:hypothetical protein
MAVQNEPFFARLVLVPRRPGKETAMKISNSILERLVRRNIAA